MAASTASVAELVQGITGPFVVGTAVSTLLCGVTLTQAFTYFTRFELDRPIYRWAVVSLLAIDIIHTALCWVTLWLWFVRHFGEATEVAVSPWSFAVDPVMCGMAAVIVQVFYAYRIYVLSNQKLLIPAIVCALSLFQLGWSAGATGMIFRLQYFENFQVWTYGVAAWLGGAASCDTLVTASLVFLLARNRASSSIETTNNMIDKLMRLTIETNGLTLAFALLDVILFATRSDAAHVAPNLCLIKLYLNSLLVSLNSRAELSRNFGGSRSIHLKDVNKSDGSNCSSPSQRNLATGAARLQQAGVHVLTTAQVHTERAADETSCDDSMEKGRIRPDKGGYSANVTGGARAIDFDAKY